MFFWHLFARTVLFFSLIFASVVSGKVSAPSFLAPQSPFEPPPLKIKAAFLLINGTERIDLCRRWLFDMGISHVISFDRLIDPQMAVDAILKQKIRPDEIVLLYDDEWEHRKPVVLRGQENKPVPAREMAFKMKEKYPGMSLLFVPKKQPMKDFLNGGAEGTTNVRAIQLCLDWKEWRRYRAALLICNDRILRGVFTAWLNFCGITTVKVVSKAINADLELARWFEDQLYHPDHVLVLTDETGIMLHTEVLKKQVVDIFLIHTLPLGREKVPYKEDVAIRVIVPEIKRGPFRSKFLLSTAFVFLDSLIELDPDYEPGKGFAFLARYRFRKFVADLEKAKIPKNPVLLPQLFYGNGDTTAVERAA